MILMFGVSDLFKMTAPTKKLLGDLEEFKQLINSADHCKAVHSNELGKTLLQCE